MFVRNNSVDILLVHGECWMKWLNEFSLDGTDSVFDRLKVTSQFDANVYICERSEINIAADWIGFLTIIKKLVSSAKWRVDELILRIISFM